MSEAFHPLESLTTTPDLLPSVYSQALTKDKRWKNLSLMSMSRNRQRYAGSTGVSRVAGLLQETVIIACTIRGVKRLAHFGCIYLVLA